MDYQELATKYCLDVFGGCKHSRKKHVFIRGVDHMLDKDTGNITQTEPLQVESYSCPPEEKVGRGRANRPKQPVIYCAESARTIARELRLCPMQWFHLAVWYTPQPIELELLYFLYEKRRVDGIVYPSVQDDSFCNFAFHPDLVKEKKLRLHWVIKSRLREDGENFDFHQVGRFDSTGALEWSVFRREEDGREHERGYPSLLST